MPRWQRVGTDAIPMVEYMLRVIWLTRPKHVDALPREQQSEWLRETFWKVVRGG